MSPILYEALRDTLLAMSIGVVIGLVIHPSLLINFIFRKKS